MLNIDNINELCLRGESNSLDYKREQYVFFKAKPEEKGELLKDMLAMANADRAEFAFILIGIEELPNKLGKIVGIPADDVIDDAILHQFVNQKTNAFIPFRSYAVPSGIVGRECIQVVEIDNCRDHRPFFLKSDFGKLNANLVYMRDGTTTVVANPTQIREMGESAQQGKARPVVELPADVKVERDWSAAFVENASIEDLDENAVAQARKGFAEAHADRMTQNQISGWPVMTFLEKVRLAVDGKLTRAALLLLGKREASAKLSPYVAQITWNLGGQRAYEHFSIPFILTTTAIYRKIRNFNLSIVPQGSMLPVVVPKYVEKVILEPLHNCIAHQDYNMQERIVLTEYDDYVEMENAGSFFEGAPSDYIDGRKRPRFYRNRLLAEAMSDLHMIDAMGYGIHDIYEAQRTRYLPMPDYVTEGERVVARVYGTVVDDAYSRLLIAKTDLPLADVMNLDRVQKHLPISKPAAAHLRRMHFIEGNGKLVRVTSAIAEMTDKKIEYIQFKATEDAHLKRMVLDYIGQFGQATRRDIEKLLIGKMHESLTDDEKMNKVGNLLTSLRIHGQIVNIGSRKKPVWVMSKA